MTTTNTNSLNKEASDNPLSSLHDLFERELYDMYCSEKVLVAALPKMIEEANSEDLKELLDEHLDVTEIHLERLDLIFSEMKLTPKADKCEAMEAILEENTNLMKASQADSIMHEVALIAGAQKIEHYEIAGYGSLCSLAKVLGHNSAAELLQATLDEETQTEGKLSEIAESMTANEGME